MLNKITDNQLSNLFIKINKDKDNLNILLKAINNYFKRNRTRAFRV